MSTCAADPKGVIQVCPSCGRRNRILFDKLGSPSRCGECKADLPPLGCAIDAGDEEAFASVTSLVTMPVLVDFWADWCGPCKMMAPELEKFATGQAGKIAVVKLNTEVVPSVSQRFNISAIPTLVLFAGGREVARAQGAQSTSQILAFVSSALARSG